MIRPWHLSYTQGNVFCLTRNVFLLFHHTNAPNHMAKQAGFKLKNPWMQSKSFISLLFARFELPKWETDFFLFYNLKQYAQFSWNSSGFG